MDFIDEYETNSFISPSVSQEDLYSDIFPNIFARYHIPFTQTSFSRMDSSVFTLKLKELQDSTVPPDNHQLLRKKWLYIAKNSVLLNRLDTLFDYFLEANSNAKFLLQRKFFRKWATRTVDKSNREKWLRISSLIRTIYWKKNAQDYSTRLDTQRVEIASNYLISQKEYKNPRFNFFILNSIPFQTQRQKELEETELEHDKQRDLRHLQGIWSDDGQSFDQNDEIQDRDVSISPKKKKRKSPIKKDKPSPKPSPIQERTANEQNHIETNQQQSKKLKILIFVLIALAALGTSLAAFALGFGTPVAYLIHKGEYNSFSEFLQSKVSKPIESISPSPLPPISPPPLPLISPPPEVPQTTNQPEPI